MEPPANVCEIVERAMATAAVAVKSAAESYSAKNGLGDPCYGYANAATWDMPNTCVQYLLATEHAKR